MRTVLEFERRPEAEYRRIFEGLAGEWRRLPGGAAARVDDVLEVWLQRPAVLYLVLVAVVSNPSKFRKGHFGFTNVR